METSVISYLAARPARDVVVAAHQELTREWWEERARQDYVERFDYDVRALAADLRRLEQQHRERLVTLPPKPAPRRKTA